MQATSKRPIGKYSEGHLIKVARKAVKEKTAKTRLFDENLTAPIPKFPMSELDVGRVLGRGGFCVVNEVRVLGRGGYCVVNEVAIHDKEASFINEEKDSSYAIKRVSKEATRRDVDRFVNGMVDLAMEAKFLAALQHPNIINLRGLSDGEPCTQSFFVVLDRLCDILTRRLRTWKKHKPSGIKKIRGGNRKKAMEFWLERMKVARDIASALEYLHSCQ